MLGERLPRRLKGMAVLGTDSTIAIQERLPSERLTMTQQRGTERWIHRHGWVSRDRREKCVFLNTGRIEWEKKVRPCSGNYQKVCDWKEDIWHMGLVGREFQLCKSIEVNGAIWCHMFGEGHPCVAWRRPLAAEIDPEQCVFSQCQQSQCTDRTKRTCEDTCTDDMD